MNFTIPVNIEFPEKRFRELLDEEIEKYVSAWTPVTESLPETEGMYLVTVENYDGKKSLKTSQFINTESGGAWIIETSPMYTVLAWMNLPEIWEG